jgi:hypothetical protein
MSKRLRQAGQVMGAVSHHTARSVGTFLLVMLLAFGAASWRLSRGPVAIPLLAGRIANAVSAALPGTKITIARAALAWEGFHRGGAPLDLRLSTITLRAPGGSTHGTISHLRVTLSPLALLRGRIAPIDIIARRTRVSLRAPSLALPNTKPNAKTYTSRPTAAAQPIAAAPPVAAASSRHALDLSALRRIKIENATIQIGAGQDPIALAASGANLQVTRTAHGQVSGSAVAIFTHGTTQARVQIAVAAREGRGQVTAMLAPVNLAQLMPDDAPLARFNLPVSISLRWPIGPQRRASPVMARASLGAGSITLDGSAIPIASGTLAARLAGGSLRLTSAHIMLAARGGVAPIVTGTGHLALTGTEAGALHLAVDHAAAPSLLAYWPKHFIPNVRLFVQNRIPAGQASQGIVTLGFELAPTVRITQFEGGFTAHALTLDWFTGAAPITDLRGTLHIDNPDQITIRAQSGQLAGAALHGKMLITGLTQPRQLATITADLAGPLASAIPALDQPPLSLARRAVAFTGATGHFTAAIKAGLPLVKPLKLSDVALTASVDLSGVDWAPIAGLPIQQGAAHLDVDLHHLALHGTGLVAQAPTRFTARMNLPAGTFRLQAHSALNRVSAQKLGFPAGYWRHGTAPLALAYQTKAGAGALALTLDLTQPSLAIPALGWHKRTNQPAGALLGLAFPAHHPLRITRLSAQAPSLRIDATAEGGSLHLQRLRIGATRAHGQLTPPLHAGMPWQIRLRGQALDLTQAIGQSTRTAKGTSTGQSAPSGKSAAPDSKTGALWHVNAQFDQIRLAPAPAPALNAVQINAFGTGTGLDALTATATPSNTMLDLRRAGAVLNVRLTASHTGALLASLGVGHLILGGDLSLIGQWGAKGLDGRASLSAFRIPHAPIMGKVLQGMTVYGLGDATSGPGLAFTRLVARLRLAKGVLTVVRGRAFSGSLGLTAAGQIDLADKNYDIDGTIIPAYALNTLPGKIPLLGKLFRPAKGGGLFAAHYALSGPFAKPSFSVNPLAALTPGVLGRVFNAEPPTPSVNVSKHP